MFYFLFIKFEEQSKKVFIVLKYVRYSFCWEIEQNLDFGWSKTDTG